MQRLIVANWKMHFGPQAASQLVSKLATAIKPDPNVEVVICPPALDLFAVAKETQAAGFGLGAQNLFYEDEGAYTGETSGPMLKDLASYVIVGHSERRRYFGDDDQTVAKKLAAAVRNDLAPILCVGENLAQRQANLAAKVVADQVLAAVRGLGPEDLAKLAVAYEPIWALSTSPGGRADTPADVEPMMKLIAATLAQTYGAEAAAGVRLLYGGSVDGVDAKAFLDVPDVDGLLVGGASLHADSFAAIVAAAQTT